MTIFLDLAGSFVIRASMVTVMLGLTVTMNNALYETTQQTNTRAIVQTVGDVFYEDLNLAVASAFTTAETNRMTFQADTSLGGGNTVLISYDASEIDPSTGLRKLYRQEGSARVMVSRNLVSAQFSYFDVNGQPTSLPSNVNSIRVKLIAKVEGSSEGLSTSTSDFRVFPPNLN